MTKTNLKVLEIETEKTTDCDKMSDSCLLKNSFLRNAIFFLFPYIYGIDNMFVMVGNKGVSKHIVFSNFSFKEKILSNSVD